MALLSGVRSTGNNSSAASAAMNKAKLAAKAKAAQKAKAAAAKKKATPKPAAPKAP